jgi:hypothetical protein
MEAVQRATYFVHSPAAAPDSPVQLTASASSALDYAGALAAADKEVASQHYEADEGAPSASGGEEPAGSQQEGGGGGAEGGPARRLHLSPLRGSLPARQPG